MPLKPATDPLFQPCFNDHDLARVLPDDGLREYRAAMAVDVDPAADPDVLRERYAALRQADRYVLDLRDMEAVGRALAEAASAVRDDQDERYDYVLRALAARDFNKAGRALCELVHERLMDGARSVASREAFEHFPLVRQVLP